MYKHLTGLYTWLLIIKLQESTTTLQNYLSPWEHYTNKGLMPKATMYINWKFTLDSNVSKKYMIIVAEKFEALLSCRD